jgi:pimeloyl-ACP methyl ester carboxylesterase
MESVRETFPKAVMKFIENGKHAPHCEETAVAECNAIVRDFLSTA